MNKFLISKIWSQNLLNLQCFCSRIFGVTLPPNKNVEQKLDENNTSSVNVNLSENIQNEESSTNNNLIKIAKENITDFSILPPITINDIEDEFDEFEDFFDSSPLENIIQPYDKKIIQPINDILIKPIDSNLLRRNLLSTITDEYSLKERMVNDILDNEKNDLVFKDILNTTNESKDEIVESMNKKLIDSINYNLLKLHLSSEIVNDIGEDIDNNIDLSNDDINDIYDESMADDDIYEFTQDDILEIENITKPNDIVTSSRNVFLKNHHQPITVNDIADEYEDDEDFYENSEENKIQPLHDYDLENEMAKLTLPKINDPIEEPKNNNTIQPKKQDDTIQTTEQDIIRTHKEVNTELNDQETNQSKIGGILQYHLPPVNVGGDDDDELLDDDPDEEEIIKRSGEYQSHGIKVFIPENKMPPGTIRYQLNKIPDGMPDDIRVIHYD